MKEERRQQFFDTEEALAWVNLSQGSIDDEWLKLANDMEDAVLERYQIKKKFWSKYKGIGSPVECVYKKVGRKKARLRAVKETVFGLPSSRSSTGLASRT